jgi:hypothetical protein
VKLGSLNRVLEIVLQEDSNEGIQSTTTPESLKRRALNIILNQLPTTRSIRSMEIEAKQRLNTNTMKEMLMRTPLNLETPRYKVLTTKKTWEVRKYEDFAVCSTTMKANEAGPGSFNALAGYIFGKNAPAEKMAMTTPVLSTVATTTTVNKDKKMSFVMPSRFWNSQDALAGAPKPIDTSVTIESKGGGLISSSNTIAVRSSTNTTVYLLQL